MEQDIRAGAKTRASQLRQAHGPTSTSRGKNIDAIHASDERNHTATVTHSQGSCFLSPGSTGHAPLSVPCPPACPPLWCVCVVTCFVVCACLASPHVTDCWRWMRKRPPHAASSAVVNYSHKNDLTRPHPSAYHEPPFPSCRFAIGAGDHEESDETYEPSPLMLRPPSLPLSV